MKRLVALVALLAIAAQDSSAKKFAKFSCKEFDARRESVMKTVKADLIIVPGASLATGEAGIDANTERYDFRFLSGWQAEGAYLVLIPAEKKTMLFVDGDDAKRKEISGATGIADVLPAGQFVGFLKKVVTDDTELVARAYTTLYQCPKCLKLRGKKDDACCDTPLRVLEGDPVGTLLKENGLKPSMVRERKLSNPVTRLRQIKSETEAAVMQVAIDATALAHRAAMKKCKAGMNEGELMKIIEDTFKENGCDELGFPSIVGSGKNGTILHYMENHDEMKDGTLVVCDIGAAYLGYSADMTRTIPVNGKFTEEERKIYQCVLDAQKAAEAVCKPGATWDDLDNAAAAVFKERKLTKWSYSHSKDWGVRHGLGHFVGLSVHDSGFYVEPLKEGDVITIEPGYYDKDQAIGVRIEDDYLITKDGFRRMTDGAPREIDEIEKMMSDR